MSSISSVNPGVSDLLQIFSASSGLPSALSSSELQSALAQAPPSDLVQLSKQALLLQQTAGLFDSTGASQSTADPGTQLLQWLGQNAAKGSGSAPNSAAAPETPSEQIDSGLFGNNVSLLG
jgi:hypothetical protein